MTRMTRPLTVYDLQKQKGKKTLIQLHVDNEKEAAAAEKAGVEILSCEADHTLADILKSAPRAFISAGLPNCTITHASQGIHMGFEAIEAGASAVYCSSSLQFIEAMANEGIPVVGHVGLVPNHATWTNYRALGKNHKEALSIYSDLKTLESAGAFAVEIEVVPVQLAAYLTKNTSMITMGMGAGSGCDTQYLFGSDVLGTNTGHYPRHAKKYADLAKLENELQLERIRAFSQFVQDITTQSFPEERHQVFMPGDEFEKFQNMVDKL